MNRAELPAWTEVETAYIAGIVDGEGSIAVYRRKDDWTGFPSLQVANKDKALMEWLAVMFGGRRGSARRISLRAPGDGRTWYNLSTQRRASYQICLRLLPFLRVKQRQAELLVRFCEWKETLGYRGPSRPLTEEEQRKTSEFVSQSKALNARTRAVKRPTAAKPSALSR